MLRGRTQIDRAAHSGAFEAIAHLPATDAAASRAIDQLRCGSVQRFRSSHRQSPYRYYVLTLTREPRENQLIQAHAKARIREVLDQKRGQPRQTRSIGWGSRKSSKFAKKSSRG